MIYIVLGVLTFLLSLLLTPLASKLGLQMGLADQPAVTFSMNQARPQAANREVHTHRERVFAARMHSQVPALQKVRWHWGAAKQSL